MRKKIENEIWDIFCLKNVSFAMLYDNSGDIVWQKGRDDCGKNIKYGVGFSKELIYKTLKKPEILKFYSNKSRFNLLETESIELRDSRVKCIVILKIGHHLPYFLYLESQKQNYFTHQETIIFTHLVSLLTGLIAQGEESKKDIITISGSSNAIKMLQTRMARYAVEDEPILLLGETGVGKNYFAKLIHQISGRKGKFVLVHTPSIPEELFESEVFGHKKGAFTGAFSDRIGLVEYAENGTLFFDEISEVPLTFQAKLLHLLDAHSYRRLGESWEKESNVRIMAASNRDLVEEVEEKRFRKDLYYRLSVLLINIPPLRSRKKDIKEIIRDESRYLRGKKLSPGFWKEMLNYHWPGNIRELINVLKRTGIEVDEPVTGKRIRNVIYGHRESDDDEPIGIVDKIFKEIKTGKSFWKVVKEPFLNRDLKREEVKGIISRSLKECGGTYKNLIKFFGIQEQEYKNFMRFIYDNDLK